LNHRHHQVKLVDQNSKKKSNVYVILEKDIFRFTSTGFVPVTVVGISTRDNG
jgi:hypothetical protein